MAIPKKKHLLQNGEPCYIAFYYDGIETFVLPHLAMTKDELDIYMHSIRAVMDSGCIHSMTKAKETTIGNASSTHYFHHKQHIWQELFKHICDIGQVKPTALIIIIRHTSRSQGSHEHGKNSHSCTQL